MNEKYTFGDALSWLNDNEMRIALTLNGIRRVYYKRPDGDIMCIPNGKPSLAYKVREFKLDAVLSTDWELLDD